MNCQHDIPLNRSCPDCGRYVTEVYRQASVKPMKLRNITIFAAVIAISPVVTIIIQVWYELGFGKACILVAVLAWILAIVASVVFLILRLVK